MFDSLLDESRFVKQIALARDEAAARDVLSM